MVSAFSHITELGTLADGVFLNKDRPDRAYQTDENDGKPTGGNTDSWCKGFGHRTAKEVPGHLYTRGGTCHSWNKGFTRQRRKRYITRAPNSSKVGLYIEGNPGKTNLGKGEKVIIGVPCPEAASTAWVSNQKAYENDREMIKLECTYKDIDDTMLVKMSKALGSDETAGPRFKMVNAVANHYCSNPSNAHKVITKEGDTCKSVYKQKNLAQEFCKIDNNIARNTTLCSPENIGDQALYDKLGAAFCKANPKDPWCGCYNVIYKVCDTNKNANGCASVEAQFAEMEAQGMNTKVFRSKPQCTAPSCNKPLGDVWKPAGDSTTMTCDQKINICTQAIEQGVAKGSPITANCEFNDTEIKQAAANGSTDPAKALELAANADKIAAASATAAAAERMDSGTPGESLSGGGGSSNTTFYIIGFLLVMCMCAAIAGIALM